MKGLLGIEKTYKKTINMSKEFENGYRCVEKCSRNYLLRKIINLVMIVLKKAKKKRIFIKELKGNIKISSETKLITKSVNEIMAVDPSSNGGFGNISRLDGLKSRL